MNPTFQRKGIQNMCKHCEHQHGGDCDCEGRGSECRCGCGEGSREGRAHRRYQTKAEQITELETYLEGLKSEVQAVEEHLTDLRK